MAIPQVVAPIASNINFNVEVWDRLNEYDNLVGYSFTPRRAGYYAVMSQVALIGTVAGAGNYHLIRIMVNGLPYSSSPLRETGVVQTLYSFTETILYLTLNDTVTIEFHHVGVGNRTINAGEGVTFFTVQRVY